MTHCEYHREGPALFFPFFFFFFAYCTVLLKKERKSIFSIISAARCRKKSTVNSLIATTSQIILLFFSQTLFQKLCRKRPLPKFPKRPRPLFGPEIRYIPLFSVSGKRPPGMITYDRKSTVARMSQKLIFE